MAFTLFIGRPAILERPSAAAMLFASCMVTAGIGFVLHELAHKFVAMRFRRPAVFRADYSLLFLTVMSGIIGFLFAAPGAVHHRGPADRRVHGLIALAGPVTNLGLVAVFAGLTLVPSQLVASVAGLGVWINGLLAAFNMLPFGPLDGRTVWRWHPIVFIAVFVPSLMLGLVILFGTTILPW